MGVGRCGHVSQLSPIALQGVIETIVRNDARRHRVARRISLRSQHTENSKRENRFGNEAEKEGDRAQQRNASRVNDGV